MTLEQTKQFFIGVLNGWFTNKSVLDKFSESNGKVLYDGSEIGSGSGGSTAVGGQYYRSDTVLYNGDAVTTGNYTLLDNISNYDAIQIISTSVEDGRSPIMTSDTTPAPSVVAASTIYDTAHSAYFAFNGNVADSWCSKSGSGDGWVSMYNPHKVPIKKFILYTTTEGKAIDWNYPPETVILQGSNDNINYTNIQSYSTGWTSTSSVGNMECVVNSCGNFLYYRFYMQSSLPYKTIGDIAIYYDSEPTVYTNIIKEYNVKYLPLQDSSFGTIKFSGTTMNITSFRNTINKIIGIKYTPTV